MPVHIQTLDELYLTKQEEIEFDHSQFSNPGCPEKSLLLQMLEMPRMSWTWPKDLQQHWWVTNEGSDQWLASIASVSITFRSRRKRWFQRSPPNHWPRAIKQETFTSQSCLYTSLQPRYTENSSLWSPCWCQSKRPKWLPCRRIGCFSHPQ